MGENDTELFDIADAHGSLTGERCARTHAHRLGLWHHTARIWVFNARGEVLVQLRSPQKEAYPNCWDVASAGHVEAGSTPHESALREMHEELGVHVTPEALRWCFVQQAVLDTDTVRDFEHQHVFLCISDWPVEAFTLQAEEVSAVMYMPPGVLRARIASGDASIAIGLDELERVLALL